MTPEQFTQLLALIDKIANHQFTIAGAADWPILATLGSGFFIVLAFMWRDLKATIKEGKSEWKGETEKLWQAMSDCQHDCCPRKKE